MFLPPYSSKLNPIELLWGLLKKKWASNLQIYADDLSQVRESRSGDQFVNASV